MTSQGLAPVPASSTLEYVEDQIQSPDLSNSPATQPTASSSALKRKRNLPGTPDPDSEVVALSPNSLMATNRFLCELCNKGFQRDQNLQLHRRGHNLPWKLKQRSNKEIVKKKVYICPEKSCVHHDPSRALGDLTGIKKHFSRKHGEKKWKCDRCPKKYAVKSDWKAHSKICGTREHKCDCGTLFSRKDSFITHRAFCSAVADQSGSRYTPSAAAAGTNNLLSSGNGFLSGTFGNPQITETHHFSGGSGGFYPSSFHPYGHLDGSKPIRLERHPLNASTHFVTGNPAANLTHELLLQHAGQTNLFGSSTSSGAPWPDQPAFGNVNMSSLDQMIGNTSDGGGVLQVKREDEILSNEDFVENMDNPTNLNQQQQAITSNQYANQFLSSFLGRNNNGHLRYGLSNGQEFMGFAENSFFNSSFSRPSPVSKDWDNNLNHLILMHEATAAATVKQETQQQAVESSETRDFLGVGGNEISREQLLLAASSEQSNSAADLDMCRHNQQWKH